MNLALSDAPFVSIIINNYNLVASYTRLLRAL
jgi:hypothetical protein